MKMRWVFLKGVIGGLLIGFLAFSGSYSSQAEPEETRKELKIVLTPKVTDSMTYLEFVNILADILGLERPADADKLSEAELFEVLTNMLAERGLPLFVNTEAGTLVTYRVLAEVLYGALIGPSDAPVEEKITYLVDLGYIKTGEPDTVLMDSQIIDALNIPELSRAIAEGYSAPGGANFIGIDPAPSNPAPENVVPRRPASPI